MFLNLTFMGGKVGKLIKIFIQSPTRTTGSKKPTFVEKISLMKCRDPLRKIFLKFDL